MVANAETGSFADAICIGCGTPTTTASGIGYPACWTCMEEARHLSREELLGASSTISAVENVDPSWRLVDPATIEPRAMQWLWRSRIATGTLTLLAGPGGVGKGALWIDLVSQATRGQLDGDLYGQRVPVLILTAEERIADVIVPRLRAARADLAWVRVMTMFEDGYDRDATLPDDLPALREAIAQHGARFVVIDPLNAHLADRIDSHKDAPLRRALGPLARLAGETGAAIAGVAHTNKGHGDAVTRVLGSVAYVNTARSVLIVGTPPDMDDAGMERVVAMPKANNTVPVPSLRFRLESRLVDLLVPDGTEWVSQSVVGISWLGEDNASANDLLGSADDRSALSEAADWLKDHLADGPVMKAAISREARKVGITESTLRWARKSLDVVVERDHTAKGRPSTWRLPGYMSSHNGNRPLTRNRANYNGGIPDYVSRPKPDTKPLNALPTDSAESTFVDPPRIVRGGLDHEPELTRAELSALSLKQAEWTVMAVFPGSVVVNDCPTNDGHM